MDNVKINLGISEDNINILYPMCDEQENSHILILGKSGAGKSCAKSEIICQLLNNKKRVIEIDFSNSTRKSYYPIHMCEKINIKTSDMISLFERFHKLNGDLEEEADYCRRIAEIICKKCKFREKQRAILLRILIYTLRDYKTEQLTLDMIINTLLKKDIDESVQISIYNKLFILNNIKAFNTKKSCWNKIFSEKKYQMTILDLSEFNEPERSMVAELILENLKCYLQYNMKEQIDFQLVIDECKELSYETNMPMDFFLTQGRKYKCGLILVTQTLSDFKKNEKSKLLQPSLMLNFKPSYNEVELVAKLIPQNKQKPKIEEEIRNLCKGQCIATGRFLNKINQVTDSYSLKVNFQINNIL